MTAGRVLQFSLTTLMASAGFLLALAPAVSAHRLDEYLEATRIDISPHRVVLEVDLTPGAGVAPGIVALIDVDRDDRISTTEGDAYADRAMRELVLELDGRRQPLSLVRNRFPSVREMSEGLGVIRLEVTAKVPSGTHGQHWLSYRNNHQPDVGVYLVNALIPTAGQIAIEGQERDPLQRGMRLDFNIGSGTQDAGLTWLLIVGLGLSGLAGHAYLRWSEHRTRHAAPAHRA